MPKARTSQAVSREHALKVADAFGCALAFVDMGGEMTIAGSIRREEPQVRDIDILLLNPEAWDDMPEVPGFDLEAFGERLASGQFRGMQINLRRVKRGEYGAALDYYTGPVGHNIGMRQVAKARGYKLNEYGLFNIHTNQKVAGADERDIYSYLGVEYKHPSERGGKAPKIGHTGTGVRWSESEGRMVRANPLPTTMRSRNGRAQGLIISTLPFTYLVGASHAMGEPTAVQDGWYFTVNWKDGSQTFVHSRDAVMRPDGTAQISADAETERGAARAGDLRRANPGHKPPASVRKAAQRGLDLRREFGRGGTAVGIARARDLARGANISDSTIKRMVSYFARHAVDKKPGWSKPSNPTNGYIAWLLWGGDAGRSWANKIKKQIERDNPPGLKTKVRRLLRLTPQETAPGSKSLWMPQPVQDVVARYGNRINAWLAAEDMAVDWDRGYGCGAFGCVWPLLRDGEEVPRLVLKLSADYTEGPAVQAIMESGLNGTLPGLVTYYGVRRFERPVVYLIIRENVLPLPRGAEPDSGQPPFEWEYHRTHGWDRTPISAEDWMTLLSTYNHHARGLMGPETMRVMFGFSGWAGSKPAGKEAQRVLKRLGTIRNKMKRYPELKQVAIALEKLAKADIVLADVHPWNLGFKLSGKLPKSVEWTDGIERPPLSIYDVGVADVEEDPQDVQAFRANPAPKSGFYKGLWDAVQEFIEAIPVFT